MPLLQLPVKYACLWQDLSSLSRPASEVVLLWFVAHYADRYNRFDDISHRFPKAAFTTALNTHVEGEFRADYWSSLRSGQWLEVKSGQVIAYLRFNSDYNGNGWQSAGGMLS